MRVTRHAYAVDGWGVGELWEAGGRLVVAHDPPAPRPEGPTTHPRGTPGVPTETLAGPPERRGDAFATEVLQRIHRFFAGERVGFTDIALDVEGFTPFQLAVSSALRRLPWGEVVTYGELAELAGYPRAGRAVGTFCAHNRYFLLLPCHRVVAAGGLGPYGSLGSEYKRRLLRLEGHGSVR